MEHMARNIIWADAHVRDVLDTVFPGRAYDAGFLPQFLRHTDSGSQSAGRRVSVIGHLRKSDMDDNIYYYSWYRSYRHTYSALEPPEK